MCKESMKTVEEKRLHGNALKTAIYLFDALRDEDYESARIEIEELVGVVKSLQDLEVKRDRREMLSDLVVDMKKRGINIDFAKRLSFLPITAKNAVEIYQNNSKIDKKRQQA